MGKTKLLFEEMREYFTLMTEEEFYDEMVNKFGLLTAKVKLSEIKIEEDESKRNW